MKFVISPAKTLDFETALPTEEYSKPRFLADSRKLILELKKMSPDDLSALMDISPKLAEVNWHRIKKWKTPFTAANARPAVYAFNGDVYVGLDAYSIPTEKITDMQDRLRILSGLYGVLRPLDLIQPYRLEMGTRLQTGDNKNLYQYWKEKVTNSLNKDLKRGEVLLNLASKEYFDVIDITRLKGKIITPEFRDFHDGSLKMISFFAKKGRGLMVRFLIENNIQDIEGVKSFDSEGYLFDQNLSTENKYVFTR